MLQELISYFVLHVMPVTYIIISLGENRIEYCLEEENFLFVLYYILSIGR